MRSFVSRPIVSWGMLALAAVVAVATGVDLIASAQSSTTRQLSNLIQNGSFETPKAWTFEVTGGAQGSFTYDRSTKEDGTYSARVSVFASTLTVPWNVQLHQDGIPLHAGTPLTLSFWAKGSTGTARLPISLQQDVAPHTVYFSRTISLSTSWQQFMFDFTPTRTDSRSLLDFNYAGQVASVWIDHVVLNDSVTATGGTSSSTGGTSATPTDGTSATATGGTSTATPTGGTPIPTTAVWSVSDDGAFVTAESSLLKLRFAYNARNSAGWFGGSGGQDGAIVELYYKPYSTTSNLIFRNGTYGGTYDALDEWEAEYTATDQAGFNSPDVSSNRDGTVVAHSVQESAGRLLADFTVNFAAWQFVRHYIVYPNGVITISTDIHVVTPGYWNYLGHRFNFAGSQYQVVNGSTTYNWGTDWQNTASQYSSWTDGVNRYTGGPLGASPTYGECDQTIRANAQTNVIANGTSGQCSNGMTSRDDSFSGFLIKGHGAAPSIMVFQGAPNDWSGPFSAISRKVAQNPKSASTDYRSYIETALYSFNWAPNNETQVGTTWFYMTTPGQSPDNDIWNKRGYWDTSLGTWTETMNLIINPDLQTSDYLPVWQERARDLAAEAPTNLVGATGVSLGTHDQRYHLAAQTGATQISFMYKRAADNASGRSIGYDTQFVVDNVSQPTQVLVNGAVTSIPVYYDATAHTALIDFNMVQPATATAYTISLRTSG